MPRELAIKPPKYPKGDFEAKKWENDWEQDFSC